jgi:hypothetical protein
MSCAFKPRVSLTGQRKMETFLMRRPAVLILCVDSALLMRLQVGPTKGRKAT